MADEQIPQQANPQGGAQGGQFQIDLRDFELVTRLGHFFFEAGQVTFRPGLLRAAGFPRLFELAGRLRSIELDHQVALLHQRAGFEVLP